MGTTKKPDIAYTAAAPEHRFAGGDLGELWARLSAKAKEQDPGRWWYFVLPGGALVYLRVSASGSGRRQLLVSRRGGFKTAAGPDLFRREVDTFLRAFGEPQAWERLEKLEEREGPSVLFTEPPRLPGLEG